MIKIGNKKITGIYIKVGTVVKRLLLQGKTENQIRNFIIYSLQKSLEYQFNESTSSSRSNTFTIDNLISIDEITVDNGSVTYSVAGNKITVNVSGGNSRSEYDSSKYSKSASDYKTSSTNSFPSSMSYSSDGYSGTLYKDGGSYVSSGEYIPSDEKYLSSEAIRVLVSYENGTKVSGDIPSTYNYNKYGYSGRLQFSGPTEGTRLLIEKILGENLTGNYSLEFLYSGSVSKPSVDTRIYRQNYKGYIYKGGYNYYYKYKIDMKYTIKN